MAFLKTYRARLFAFAALCRLFAFAASARGQGEPAAQEQADANDEEVVRISSELVQTDVAVFDKQGRFVEGLRQEDFEVYLDGRLQPLSFFESVVAGSGEEAAQLKAARAGSPSAGKPRRAAPDERGRLAFFFVGDLHLSPDSGERTRRGLRRFVDELMGPNDQAVVTSASGQIGFLQQLTSNKAVLRAAIERLKHIPYNVRDNDRPPMGEYLAHLIERNDQEVVGAFVSATVKDTGLDPRTAERLVRNRSRAIARQSDAVNRNLLASLQSMMRSAAQYPGRKLVYFISDGFLLNRGKSVHSFSQRLTIPLPAPGLYQVRVAARDTRGGRVGSAMEWVEIPSVKPGGFSMSSLFLGERAEGAEAGAGGVLVSVDRRFARSSRLRFLTYIYNAAHGPAPPDVTVKVEVLRDGQAVVNAPEQKVSTAKAANPASLPYAAEISLGSLPAGRYVLQVTATDRAAKTSSTQRADFTVL